MTQTQKPAEKDLLKRFIGPNAEAYLKTYESWGEKRYPLSFNPYAFFITPAWFLYRRMYPHTAVFVVAFFVCLGIFSAGLVSLVLMLALFAAASAFSHYMYLAFALKQVRKEAAEALTEDALYDALEKKGGVNRKLGTLGLILPSFVFFVFMIFATDFISQRYYPGYMELVRAKDALQAGHIEQATDLFRQAAKNGNIDAQHTLGLALLSGKKLGKDPKEAAKWLARAAEGGHAPSQAMLGALHLGGKNGVPVNTSKAAEMFKKAARSGNSGAQVILAHMYAEGNGVPPTMQKRGRGQKPPSIMCEPIRP